MKKNILLLSVALLAGLLILEVALRYLGRYESYTERNGIAAYVSPFDIGDETWYHTYPAHYRIENTIPFSTDYLTNNEGFRDVDFEIKKQKKRILTLGDSFTEGIGATNDSTFQKQLQAMLLARDLDNVEVYNAGVSGSDPVFEYRLFIDKLTQYQPDLLILTVNASDISDIKIRGGFERFQPDSTVRFNQGPWFEKYYAHSRLVRVLVHDIFRYDWQFISPAQQTSKNYQANNILCQAADSFSALSVIYGFKILLVFHPTMYEFKNRVPYEFTPLIRYCQMKEIPYVDVREAFIQSGIRPEDADKYYWPVDQHYNNAGYGRFSASIYKKVIGLLQ